MEKLKYKVKEHVFVLVGSTIKDGYVIGRTETITEIPCYKVAFVDEELPTLSVKIRVLGTGNPIAAGLQLRYIGTVCGVFVWHVFIDDTEGVNCVTKN